MERTTLAACAVVALAAAIAIPSIAFSNARRDLGNLQASQAQATPYVATLTGPAELTATTFTGDPDGVGAAAVTFDLTSTAPQVCWDLSYSGIISPPIFAHIHGPAAAGVFGPIVVPFTPFINLGATSATGCADVDLAVATEIIANPSNYYVNVHTIDFRAGAIRGQLAVGPAPAGEAHLLPVPLRAYDSRDAAGPKILPGDTRTISLASGRDEAGTSLVAVPPGASAAIVTLTVTETAGNGGFLTIYSAAVPQPATSNINWKAVDQDIAVSTQVVVDAAGMVKVTDGAGGGATHFIIDVVGYLY